MLAPTYVYRAVVSKIVDADTMDLKIDLGFRIGTLIRVRLLGINAPEMRTQEGKAAKGALLSFLPIGSEVIVRTYKDPVDKFGRWLGNVEVTGIDIARWLVANSYAVEKDY